VGIKAWEDAHGDCTQRLRKKLGVDRIETVYKCGYRLKMA
jgi:DNA-binding response OmpR family regulator